MLTRVKTITSLLICLTFILRLLFVNIGLISSLNTKQNNSNIRSHFSSIMKRRKGPDIIKGTENRQCTTTEICEENSNDEDNISKHPPLVLLRTLYSFILNKTSLSRTNAFLESVNFHLSLRKHLSLSILRI